MQETRMKILLFLLLLILINPLFVFAEEIQGTSKAEEVKGFTMTLANKDGIEEAIVNGSVANILPGGIIEIMDVVSRVFSQDSIGGDTLIHSSRGIYNKLKNVVDTDEFVRINRRDMVITGTGLHWEPNKFEIEIHKNVKVEYVSERNNVNSEDPSLVPQDDRNTAVTVITAEGSGKLNYKKGIVAIFRKNVEIDDKNANLKAHLMKMYFDKKTEALTKVEAYGNVKIKQPKRESSCRKAVYFTDEDKVVLTGNPRIIQGVDLYTAKKITIYDKGEKVVFEPRAELVLYSSTEHEDVLENEEDKTKKAEVDSIL